jgi:hypothetical protein
LDICSAREIATPRFYFDVREGASFTPTKKACSRLIG